MKYALNIAEDGRILFVTYEQFAWEGMPIVDVLPDGDTYEYRYVDGEFIHDPLPVEPVIETPSQLDRVEAQVAYIAMMTGNSDILEV